MVTTDPTRPKTYAHILPGPDLDCAWTVAEGLVAVLGECETLTLPPGATWPGLDALPPEWLDELRLAEAVATMGSRVRSVQPNELESGLALVHAQMLRTGSLTTRLTRLDHTGTGAINQSVQAALIGARRESVTKVRTEMART